MNEIKCSNCDQIIKLPTAMYLYYEPMNHQILSFVHCPQIGCGTGITLGRLQLLENKTIKDWTKEFAEVANKGIGVVKSFCKEQNIKMKER